MIIKILSLILIIFIIILALPVGIEIVLRDGKPTFSVRVLFFKIKNKKTTPKKNSKKKKETPQKESEEALFSERIIWFSEKLEYLSRMYTHTSRLTKKYLNIKELSMDLSVGTGEAATTAISTGALWGIVYGFIAALGLFVYVDNPHVNITPNYSDKEFKSNARCIISTLTVHIIIIMISILIKHKKVRRKKNGRTSN